jgi:hypothetical protein
MIANKRGTIASWLQRPQMTAFVDRVNKLVAAVAGHEITRGILLVRPDVLDDRRRTWAAEHNIELTGPAELAKLLDKHSADA